MTKNRQDTKEEAVLDAITRLHSALYRRDLSIYMVSSKGTVQKISTSNDFDTVWNDALNALKDITPGSNETSPLQHSYTSLAIYTDGGSRGNPGHSATGYVICNDADTLLEDGGSYLGVTNSNTAEYQAVKDALIAAMKYSPQQINFYCDSMLVVKQLQNIYNVKNNELWPIHQDIKRLISSFESVTFTHIPREKNEKADAKVNQILDQVISSS